MQPLAPSLNIAFADLVESAHEKAFNARFPVKGTFHKLKRGEKEYWYHVMRDSTVTSGRRTSYAGLVGDPDVDALVERHGHEHARHRLQKETASMLRRSGLPAPDPMEGKLTQAFQRAGLFQAGAILVGSVAYQAYGGILGAKLSGDLHRAQDIDLAKTAKSRFRGPHRPKAGRLSGHSQIGRCIVRAEAQSELSERWADALRERQQVQS